MHGAKNLLDPLKKVTKFHQPTQVEVAPSPPRLRVNPGSLAPADGWMLTAIAAPARNKSQHVGGEGRGHLTPTGETRKSGIRLKKTAAATLGSHSRGHCYSYKGNSPGGRPSLANAPPPLSGLLLIVFSCLPNGKKQGGQCTADTKSSAEQVLKLPR